MTPAEFDKNLRLNVGAEPGLPLPYDVLAHALTTEPGEWNGTRAHATLTAAGLHTTRNNAWGLLRHLMLRVAEADPAWQQDALFA